MRKSIDTFELTKIRYFPDIKSPASNSGTPNDTPRDRASTSFTKRASLQVLIRSAERFKKLPPQVFRRELKRVESKSIVKDFVQKMNSQVIGYKSYYNQLRTISKEKEKFYQSFVNKQKQLQDRNQQQLRSDYKKIVRQLNEAVQKIEQEKGQTDSLNYMISVRLKNVQGVKDPIRELRFEIQKINTQILLLGKQKYFNKQQTFNCKDKLQSIQKNFYLRKQLQDKLLQKEEAIIIDIQKAKGVIEQQFERIQLKDKIQSQQRIINQLKQKQKNAIKHEKYREKQEKIEEQVQKKQDLLDNVFQKTRTANCEDFIKQFGNVYATKEYLQFLKQDLEERIQALSQDLIQLKSQSKLKSKKKQNNIHGIYHAEDTADLLAHRIDMLQDQYQARKKLISSVQISLINLCKLTQNVKQIYEPRSKAFSSIIEYLKLNLT